MDDDALLLSPDDTDLMLDEDLNWDLLDYEDDREERSHVREAPNTDMEVTPTPSNEGSKLVFTKSSSSVKSKTTSSSDLYGPAKRQLLDLKKMK